MQENLISIEEIVRALKKRWLMIVLVTLITTLVSGVVNFFVIKPKYEVFTKVFVGKDEGEDQQYSQNDILMYQKILITYSEAIKTKDLIDRAVLKCGTTLDTKTILSNLTVTPLTDTQILEIKLQGSDKNEIKKVLDGITDEFISTSGSLFSNGNTTIIEASQIPQYPISPNRVRNIVIAFLFGLIVSLGISFLLEFLDNTYQTKDQLESELELPVLGIIPIK